MELMQVAPGKLRDYSPQPAHEPLSMVSTPHQLLQPNPHPDTKL